MNESEQDNEQKKQHETKGSKDEWKMDKSMEKGLKGNNYEIT